MKPLRPVLIVMAVFLVVSSFPSKTSALEYTRGDFENCAYKALVQDGTGMALINSKNSDRIIHYIQNSCNKTLWENLEADVQGDAIVNAIARAKGFSKMKTKLDKTFGN